MRNRRPKPIVSGERRQNHSVIDVGSEVERAKDIAFKYLLRRFRISDEDAEDAIQDACLSLLKTSKPFEGRSKFTSYFLAVVTNAARMQRRVINSRAHGHSVPLDWALNVPSTHNPLIELNVKQQCDRILRQLSTLPPKVREAILTYYLKEQTCGETGKALGISLSEVKARLKRGRAMIRSITDLSEGIR